MVYLYILIGLILALLLGRPILNLALEGELVVVNYRKEKIPVAIGLVFMAGIVSLAVISHLLQWEVDYKFFFVVTSVFIIGFLDDVVQDKENKGFKGHFKAFFKGKITTGFLKAAGIPAILLLYFSWDNYLVIIDLIFIALTVNLFNFFDLRPGRCQKVFMVTNLLIVVPFINNTQPLSLAILGMALYTLLLDLREKGMLGDAGANLLGVVTGLNLLAIPFRFRIIVYSMVVILTIIGEKYSFTKIIEGNSALRFLDRLGRLKHQ